MKISTIRLHNYRAFYPQFGEDSQPKPYEIVTNDKNVLIYGENGAGKTSLFRAIRDFLLSTRQRVRYENNRFATRSPDGNVEIIFSDGKEALFTNNAANITTGQDFLTPAQKASGLLTYVQIIKTYFYDAAIQPDLFDLMVTQILAEHILSSTQNRTVLNEWNSLRNRVNESRRGRVMDPYLKTIKGEDGAADTKVLNCDTFNTGFQRLLNDIKPILNDWLTRYFNYQVTVDFDFQLVAEAVNPKFASQKRELTRRLTLIIDFNESGPITYYHDFLNEARLSALAICIFLASLRTYPKDPSRLNVLYLDDVFIGLDMSNRLPLLDILRNEFSDYQIFLSTYDRAWFEVAKQVVTGWQTVEMYTAEEGKKGEPGYCERPVIITPSDDHYARARKYYDAKDYAASANYLRKELEHQIKNRVAEEDVRSFDGRYVPLQTLWSSMLSRYQTHGQAIDENIKTAFDRCKLTIFNPLSHDSLSLPVYRAELDKAFWVTDEVKKLKVLRQICMLKRGMLLTYRNVAKNYSITVQLADDWWLKADILENPLENVKVNVTKWTKNGIDFFDIRQNIELAEEDIKKVQARTDKLSKVFSNISKSLGLADGTNLIVDIEVEGYTLQELLEEATRTLTRPSFNFLMR